MIPHTGHLAVLAVQVGSTHHLMPEAHDWWQVVIVAMGLALICWGMVSTRRDRRRLDREGSPRPIPWRVVLGGAVVGIFLAALTL